MRWGNAESAGVWIIGYGNPHRRDDGVGPYVVKRLGWSLRHARECRLLSRLHLDSDLLVDLRDAQTIVLVDATAEPVAGGWRWTRVFPERGNLPYLTHHTSPGFFLGLFQSVYCACPPTWLASVQGHDFGFGEGLCPSTEKRAEAVVADIAGRILQGNRTGRDSTKNGIKRGVNDES